MTFSADQYEAAKAFAYTMIVVDDEPNVELTEEPVPTIVETPARGDSRANVADRGTDETEAQRSHPLNAKGLISSALNLGLVCSVVNPEGEEDGVAQRIAKAAKRADIISLDWHMNEGDDGELASEIIQEILAQDEASGGRLRLIAIYTGNKDRSKIFGLISERLNGSERIQSDVSEKDGALVNSSGLRLVWREKAMSRANPGEAISELQLPEELLREFSKLSEGLLTNVALAAISSMRDTTHHVLGKFKPELDAPFFHHRAFLKAPSDSMDYAVSIVLSALKSEVDKSQITAKYTSPDAIKRRIEAMEQSPENFTFRHPKNNEENEITLHLEEVVRIVTNGYDTLSDGTKRKAISDDLNARMNHLPGKKEVKKYFSTLFSNSSLQARDSMLDFSFLTNSRSSELSKIHRTSPPKLDLGSVLYSADGDYLLCLQATCDTVRGNGMFFFILLEDGVDSPDYIVPHGRTEHGTSFVSLGDIDGGYTQSRSINFGPIDPEVGHIPVIYEEDNENYYVLDADQNKYRWLANLKYKRALRTAQKVSQEMTRIGFDEFEPFRKER